jgi:hypothetical protein
MTDDQILEIAEQMFDTTTDARGRKAYDGDNHQVLAFARLIESKTKEGQPIETAPKDGTCILCWCGTYWDICYRQHKYGVGDVWMTDSCADFGGYENPTLWMPLPPAPAKVGDGDTADQHRVTEQEK